MSAAKFNSVGKSRSLCWLLCLSSMLAVCPPLTFASSAEMDQESAQATDAETIAEIESELGDKSLVQIRKMLSEQMDELDDMSGLASLRISAADRQDDEVEYIPLFVPPGSSEIDKALGEYLGQLVFSQEIVGSGSGIQMDFREYYVGNITPYYDTYGYDPVSLKVEKAHFKDGSWLSPKNSDASESVSLESNKRVMSLDVSATYTLPGTVKQLTFNESDKAPQEGIVLHSLEKRDATFVMPATEVDKILYVQALDAQGRELRQDGNSSYSHDGYYIEAFKSFLQGIVQRIDSGAISDKKQLIDYYFKNIPSKNDVEKDHPRETLSTFKFAGDPVSIKVYLKPEPNKVTRTFTLSNAQNHYENGLTTAIDDKHNLYGVIDEQGRWLIEPSYERLDQVVDYYYYGRPGRGEDHIYYLDRASKKLVQQPFYIMDSKLYENRYVIINKDSSDNRVKGLIDTKTHEIILPLAYYHIDIQGRFISTLNRSEREGRDVDYREVYLQGSHKMILSGDIYSLEFSGDRIIVNTMTRVPKELKTRSLEGMDGNGNYVYSNYDIYDTEGRRLNLEPYIAVDRGFGRDKLLLVTDVRGNQFYIDRDARKSTLDLSAYQSVEPFSNGLAAVRGGDDKYGYIDTKGRVVIPLIYKSAEYFMGGTAMVSDENTFKLITPDNKVVATLEGYLLSHSAAQDDNSPRYTFVRSGADGEEVYTNYDAKGVVIPDRE